MKPYFIVRGEPQNLQFIAQLNLLNSKSELPLPNIVISHIASSIMSIPDLSVTTTLVFLAETKVSFVGLFIWKPSSPYILLMSSIVCGMN